MSSAVFEPMAMGFAPHIICCIIAGHGILGLGFHAQQAPWRSSGCVAGVRAHDVRTLVIRHVCSPRRVHLRIGRQHWGRRILHGARNRLARKWVDRRILGRSGRSPSLRRILSPTRSGNATIGTAWLSSKGSRRRHRLARIWIERGRAHSSRNWSTPIWRWQARSLGCLGLHSRRIAGIAGAFAVIPGVAAGGGAKPASLMIFSVQ